MTDPIREVAEVERKLRGSTVEDVEVHVGDLGRSARIWIDTPEHNESFRATILASVATAIAESDGWRLSSILDPMTADDDPVMHSAVTIAAD